MVAKKKKIEFVAANRIIVQQQLTVLIGSMPFTK